MYVMGTWGAIAAQDYVLDTDYISGADSDYVATNATADSVRRSSRQRTDSATLPAFPPADHPGEPSPHALPPRQADSVNGSAARNERVPRGLTGALREHYVTIRAGVELNAREHYRRAELIFLWLTRVAPDHPVGPLMHAATLNVEMVDHEDYRRRQEFQSLLDTAEERTRAWIERYPGDAWGYVMLGHIYGYRAVYQSRFGSWFKASRLGLRARNVYHDALDRDSTCWDAYIGLGSYHYWKSAKTEFINWTGLFFKDDKTKGLREMHVALDSSYFARSAAAAGIVRINLHRKRYAEALQMSREWAARYPEGKAFLWGQALALQAMEHWDSALVAWDTLKARITADPGQSHYNYIEVDFQRAKILRELDQYDRACAVMDTVLSYPASEEVRERQKGRLKDARKYLEKKCKDYIEARETGSDKGETRNDEGG